MDNLNGLSWTSSPAPMTNKPFNQYPTLRPTPPLATSGRSTPLSAQASGPNKSPAFAVPRTTAADSFSTLVSFGGTKATLTLQEQQEKLLAERKIKEVEQGSGYDSHYEDARFWDALGSKEQTNAWTPVTSMQIANPLSDPSKSNAKLTQSVIDEDLFTAFNADTKVDKSSHHPPPPSNGRNTPTMQLDLKDPKAWGPLAGSRNHGTLGDGDDLFRLGQTGQKSTGPSRDEEDFLGDLGKPVEQVCRSNPSVQKWTDQAGSESDDPWDKAVAELVEMGFTAEHAQRAMTESGSGLNVQAAVEWMLNDAHRKAKERRNQGRERSRDGQPSTSRDSHDMRQPGRNDHRSPDVDFSKAAAVVGSNVFKTANSLWKTSQKKVQRAVADFQVEIDSSQPKWMREVAQRDHAEAASSERHNEAGVTDEALMLEGGGNPQRRIKEVHRPSGSNTPRDHPLPFQPSNRPPATSLGQTNPTAKLSKQAIEEQSAQAYISPARRKRTPQSQPNFDLQPGSGLLSSQSRPSSTPLTSSPRITSVSPKPSTPIPARSLVPPRHIPPLSANALKSSTQHRIAGTEHYSRGDYASAHQSYTNSLSDLPENHPICILLLCDRALTSLKTGIPKEAVQDVDKAIAIVGISRGEGESIDLGTGEARDKKDMKEFWGKALMRKAEALEQQERWLEARRTWHEAVEANVGGAISIQGRQRCDKAIASKPRSSAPLRDGRLKPRPTTSLLANQSSADSEAVRRLRAANQASEKADEEKFALADSVDAKISQWRDGKKDNLRALLGSLDAVLWEGSQWKKVGMHELLVNSKVKVHYMRAIAKCHPDKLPQDASIEVKLIAATVFSTLNESWDIFKAQNNM